MDYERRVNIVRLNLPEGNSDDQPALQRILLSRGLFSDLQGISKMLSRLTLALLSLALIGVAGTAGLTENVWKRIIHLDDLRVEVRTAEAEKRWKAHPTGAPSCKR